MQPVSEIDPLCYTSERYIHTSCKSHYTVCAFSLSCRFACLHIKLFTHFLTTLFALHLVVLQLCFSSYFELSSLAYGSIAVFVGAAVKSLAILQKHFFALGLKTLAFQYMHHIASQKREKKAHKHIHLFAT